MSESKVLDITDHLICVVMIPIVIIRHLWHIITALLSTLAVMLADMIEVVTGRSYPQNVQFFVYAEEEIYYTEFPMWYMLITRYTSNWITEFHMMIFDAISGGNNVIEKPDDEPDEPEEDDELNK